MAKRWRHGILCWKGCVHFTQTYLNITMCATTNTVVYSCIMVFFRGKWLNIKNLMVSFLHRTPVTSRSFNDAYLIMRDHKKPKICSVFKVYLMHVLKKYSYAQKDCEHIEKQSRTHNVSLVSLIMRILTNLSRCLCVHVYCLYIYVYMFAVCISMYTCLLFVYLCIHVYCLYIYRCVWDFCKWRTALFQVGIPGIPLWLTGKYTTSDFMLSLCKDNCHEMFSLTKLVSVCYVKSLCYTSL